VSTPATNPYSVNTVRCSESGCDHVRKDTNHWFFVMVFGRPVFDKELFKWMDRAAGERGMFITCPYEPGMELPASARPVCGQFCAQKKFERWLTTGKLE
jgi:hypothetical protein